MSVPLPSASYGLDEKEINKEEHEGSHKCLSEEVKDFAAIDSDNELPPQEVGDKVDIVFDKSIIKEILEVGNQNYKKPGRPDIVTVIYEGFYNKKKRKVFDSSNGEPVQITLGDPAYLEGFWRGMEHLKVGETARIRIKPNYGCEFVFKLVGNPKGTEQVTLLADQPEFRQKLSQKIIYYEVKLLSFVKRRDITGDGLISKTYFSEGEPCSQPTQSDELFLNIKVFQKFPDERVLFQQDRWNLAMATDPLMTKALGKILLSLRKGEDSEVEVKSKFLQSQEQQDQFAFKGIDSDQNLYMRIFLINSITCEDFYHDKSTFKRVFNKGKGGMPYIESTVKFRLKVEIDGKVIFNNLTPQIQKKIAMLPGRQDTQIISKFKDIELEDNAPKTEKEKRAEYFKKINPPQEEQEQQDEDLGMALENQFFSTSPSSPDEYLMKRLDDYEFPSLIIKGLTSMKRGEVAEFDCSKIQKLNSNFGEKVVNMQPHVKEDSKARITMELIDYSRNLPSMYRLTLQKKKERIERIKQIATRFFKAGNIKRSCKLYQKINGYYNFGDISNNFQKQDEESEEYKQTMDALLQIKKSCFVNVVVCKWKLGQFTSVVNICEQVLSDMDEKNAKCLYFLGKANATLEKYPEAIQAFKKLLEIDPSNQDVKNELALVNQKYKKDINTQSSFYSAMFKKE